MIRSGFEGGGNILNGPKRRGGFYQAQMEGGYETINSADTCWALPMSKANPWCHADMQTLKPWSLLQGRVKGTGSDLTKSIFCLGTRRHVARVKQAWKREERIRVEPDNVGLSMQRKRSSQTCCLPGHLFHVNSTGPGSNVHFPLPWLVEKPQASLSLLWVSVSSCIKWLDWLSSPRLLAAAPKTAHTST